MALTLKLPSMILRKPAISATVSNGSDNDDFTHQNTTQSEDSSHSGGSQSSRAGCVQRTKFLLEHKRSARLRDYYDLEESALGGGGFGSVYKASLREDSTVVRAVKVIDSRNLRGMVRREINILKHLDHHNICKLYETFDEGQSMYMVMELVEGKELFDYIVEAFSKDDVLDEPFARRVMKQVLGALQYCHDKGVVHRDLKPENIMAKSPGNQLSKVEVKIIDFGLAALCDDEGVRDEGALGTACYLAPEARLKACRDPAVDLWSLGMVLHALLCGNLPDSEAISSGMVPIDTAEKEYYAHISAPARAVLTGLLQIDPVDRLTAATASAMPWVKDELITRAPSKELHDTMKSFCEFRQSDTLRRAVLTAVAMLNTNEPEIARLAAQFASWDLDGDGRISKAQFKEASPAGYGELSIIFEALDSDASGEIELTEFIAASLDTVGFRRLRQTLRAAFRVFDFDCDGLISKEEFQRVTDVSLVDLHDLIPQFDQDGDGCLNFDEFCHLILNHDTCLLGAEQAPNFDIDADMEAAFTLTCGGGYGYGTCGAEDKVKHTGSAGYGAVVEYAL
eukprot:TRINITY_DN90358_c0_g1_i1.p1 TRINITY_DN90358_c0_g1~~TRINITY_DN90358_c0_g1_i1.p1  ORF type:complete len:567 (+),score=140.81 TRINITY_DN90358_c0_g1_i1:108-1808(+)